MRSGSNGSKTPARAAAVGANGNHSATARLRRGPLDLKRGGFIASYPPFETLSADDVDAAWQSPRLGLYVHLPYCRKRCTFCFYKVYTNRQAKPANRYLDALLREVDMYGARPELATRPVNSIYFGGGTPTTMLIPEFRALVGRLRRNFNITPDAEFTCEGEPGSMDARKVAVLRELGVTRLSIGVQSFNDDLLKKNGRSHGTKHAFRAFELARANGFPVINIDLMSGMVDETMQTWDGTLDTLIDLGPEHISIYRMEVYKNSLLYAAGFTGPGVGGIPTDDEELALWLRATERLEAVGYHQINGHAFIRKPEHDHLHRVDAWRGGDVLGMGVGSYSYLNGSVFQNASQWDTYVENASAGQSAVERALRLSARERMAREVILGLKLLRLDRKWFQRRHGFDVIELYPAQVEALVGDGLLAVTDDAIALTRRALPWVEIIVNCFYLPEHADKRFRRFATEDELKSTGVLGVADIPLMEAGAKRRSAELVLAE